jgi:hypothetical protein
MDEGVIVQYSIAATTECFILYLCTKIIKKAVYLFDLCS